jgi:hypothetical protein
MRLYIQEITKTSTRVITSTVDLPTVEMCVCWADGWIDSRDGVIPARYIVVTYDQAYPKTESITEMHKRLCP